MFAKLSYYAHSAQDELGNLLPYEHWVSMLCLIFCASGSSLYQMIRPFRRYRILPFVTPPIMPDEISKH